MKCIILGPKNIPKNFLVTLSVGVITKDHPRIRLCYYVFLVYMLKEGWVWLKYLSLSVYAVYFKLFTSNTDSSQSYGGGGGVMTAEWFGRLAYNFESVCLSIPEMITVLGPFISKLNFAVASQLRFRVLTMCA